MIAVGMMESSLHDVVHVIAVGYGLVPAIGAVHMIFFMAGVFDLSAAIRVRLGHGQRMLIDGAIFILVMEMAIMQIIDVVAVANGGVSTTFPVLVIVVLLRNLGVFAHRKK